MANAAALLPEQWVSIEQAAQLLGAAKDNVYSWPEYQGLPRHRAGRLSKIEMSEGNEWVRAGGADEGKNQQSGGVA